MNQITVRLPPEQKCEMKRIRLIMVLIGVMMSGRLYAQPPLNDPKMTAFIDDLMSRMTPEEKIGQLNLLSVGFDVTGPRLSRDAETKVRHGLVGGVFNTYTPVAVRKLQSLAIKESRMGIPPGQLQDCANNVMVWLGPGSFPATLPSCFTVTTDRSVWDNAVADWLARHPTVAP